MAVSEKYAKFSKKRPHRGLLGASASNSKSWLLYDSCDLTNSTTPYIAYTASDVTVLANGVDIFVDEALTEPLNYSATPVTYYAYDPSTSNSVSFVTYDGNTAIQDYAQCYMQWEGYTDCDGTDPTTVYTKYLYNGSPVGALSVGLQLYTVYTGGNLETPYPLATFVTLTPTIGWEIGNVGSGIITGTGGCPI